MLKAVLIDDERNALELLQHQLDHYCPSVQIAALAQGGHEGVEAIRLHQPDLVFVDIEMPDITGFDVLEQTRSSHYDVIFVTAYDHFAVRAFRYAAVDYLLKPLDAEELKSAVDRVQQGRQQPFGAQLEAVLGQIQPARMRIAIPVQDGYQLMEADEIVHCSSDSNYTHVYLTNQRKITLAKTLKDVEETLQGLPFYRIHHSHLVNLNHVQRLSKQDGGYVVLTNGTQISISRSKRDGLLDLIRRL